MDFRVDQEWYSMREAAKIEAKQKALDPGRQMERAAVGPCENCENLAVVPWSSPEVELPQLQRDRFFRLSQGPIRDLRILRSQHGLCFLSAT